MASGTTSCHMVCSTDPIPYGLYYKSHAIWFVLQISGHMLCITDPMSWFILQTRHIFPKPLHNIAPMSESVSTFWCKATFFGTALLMGNLSDWTHCFAHYFSCHSFGASASIEAERKQPHTSEETIQQTDSEAGPDFPQGSSGGLEV